MQTFMDFEVPALSALISADKLQELLNAAKPISYAPGQVIHLRGDQKPGLSIVRQGAVALGTMGFDGEERIITTLGPGQSFGEFTLFGNLPRTHDATAIEETIVDQVSKDAFTAFTQRYPEVIMSMLVATTKRLHAVVEFAEDLRRLPSDVHVGKILLSLGKGNSPDAANRAQDVRINQTQLGQALGLTRVSVNAALAKLEARDLIRRGYGRIQIVSPIALQAWVREQSPVEPIDG